MIKILVSEKRTNAVVSQTRNRILISQRGMTAIPSQKRNRVLIKQRQYKIIVSAPTESPIKGTAISWFGVLVKWGGNVFATWK